jgi:hypothetical protein
MGGHPVGFPRDLSNTCPLTADALMARQLNFGVDQR